MVGCGLTGIAITGIAHYAVDAVVRTSANCIDVVQVPNRPRLAVFSQITDSGTAFTYIGILRRAGRQIEVKVVALGPPLVWI